MLGEGFVKLVNDKKGKDDIFSVNIEDDYDIEENLKRYEIKSFEGDDKINIKAAVNRLIKSKSDEAKLRNELKGKKYKEEILDKDGKKQKIDIPIDEVVERLLCGEDKSKFEEEKETAEA